ncbi:hypothetical protein ABT297_42265 [Dactylosporangium sp. NPDC000555]|uniref:hypothetical protein n=1 Tax=Dactylosporangium sp. NPDC000555 TaxID=3154260 RepID=UPI003318D2EE
MQFNLGESVDELLAIHAADARRALNAFGSLAAFDGEGLPGAPALGGYDETDDVVVVARLHYGDPAADGPWACVETARLAHTRMLPGPLRLLIGHYLRLDGVRFADVDWTAGTGTIVVDGQPRRAETVHAGRWRATRCEHDAAQITVVTRDWPRAIVTVRLGSDVEPVLAGGPLGLGALHTATNGWTIPIIALGALLIAQLLAGAVASRPRHIRAKTPPLKNPLASGKADTAAVDAPAERQRGEHLGGVSRAAVGQDPHHRHVARTPRPAFAVPPRSRRRPPARWSPR